MPSGAYKPLFNGNISSIAKTNAKLGEFSWTNGATMFYNYGYDQLNRLTKMDAYNGFTPDSNSWMGNGGMMNPLDIWKERITYDANGNIQKYKRNGAAGGWPLEMDSMTYKYYAGTNRLKHIRDSVPAGAYPNYADFSDLDPQPDSNYVYDEIGNLIKDSSESITSIKWSVYGKILEINKNATNPSLATHIVFSYDAHSLPRHSGGNRISKTTEQAGNNYKKIDWYVRDAQGNTIAIYTAEGSLTSDLSSITPNATEWHIYGSSLLGTYNKEEGMNYGPGRWSWQNIFTNYPRGLRRYQLSNHLGNVEAVITDKKIAVPSDTGSLIAYYKPDVNAAEDYYPFGWAMPGRTWEANRLYRYGFNGKEYDNEVKGKWGQQDYGMRIYDPRVGRFLSVDPLTRSYPMLTPYQFASNRPIDGSDLDGKEWELRTVDNSLRQQAESVRLDNPRSYFSNPANWDIMMQDVYGNTVMGKRRDVEFHVANVQRQYNEAVGENIRNGLGGAIGYQLGGDKGSFVGAAADGIMLSFGGLPGEGYSTRPRKAAPEAKNAQSEQVTRAHSGNNNATQANTANQEVSTAEQTQSPSTNQLNTTANEKPTTLRPGPYAKRSIPASSSAQIFTKEERDLINGVGNEFGCHTCGVRTPGTKSGNWVPDHQPSTALNPENAPQELYPHCIGCSRRQGGEVNVQKKKSPTSNKK